MSVVLTDKEAFALACIVQFHNKETNMTLHCVEVLARKAVKKIYKQIENKSVTISDVDANSDDIRSMTKKQRDAAIELQARRMKPIA